MTLSAFSGFVVGLLVGGTIGIVVMAVLSFAGDEDRAEERKRQAGGC